MTVVILCLTTWNGLNFNLSIFVGTHSSCKITKKKKKKKINEDIRNSNEWDIKCSLHIALAVGETSII